MMIALMMTRSVATIHSWMVDFWVTDFSTVALAAATVAIVDSGFLLDSRVILLAMKDSRSFTEKTMKQIELHHATFSLCFQF